MSQNSGRLSLRIIFIFWLPLAATWLMMSAEGPFLSAIIARLPDPKYNLAAYGVAFSFALIIEAPVIMMMSASIALVKDMQSFLKLRNFTYALNGLATLIMILFTIPPIFYFIAEDLISLPHEVVRLTHIATIILIPWPGAIGYRRFYQGILIRNNLTRRVAYGTIIRLTSMAATALFFYLYTDVEGVIVGASALSSAVMAEAAASKLMSLGILKKIRQEKIAQGKLRYSEIYSFYYPLALTSLITLGVHPLVTFFLGQSRMALESLAVLPVINSFVFIFRSIGLSYQEVGIALLGEKKEEYVQLKKFALILGFSVVVILGVISFTPLADFWFYTVSGLSSGMTEFARIPLIILVIMPGLTILISFQRAILVDGRKTKSITLGTIAEFVGIILLLFILINFFNVVGAIAAAAAFIFGRLAANVYLAVPYLSVVRSYKNLSSK